MIACVVYADGHLIDSVKKDCALHPGSEAPTPDPRALYAGYENQVMLEGPHFDPEPTPNHHRIIIISYVSGLLTRMRELTAVDT